MTNQNELTVEIGPYSIDKTLLSFIVRTTVKTALREIVPMICQNLKGTLDQTLEEYSRIAQERDATIGVSGAEHISFTLKDVARKIAPASKQLQQSIRSAVEMDLRTALDHHGTGKAWKTLPLAKWEQAKAELKKLVAQAEVLSRANPSSECQGEGNPVESADKKGGTEQ
jgi:hypothetical protein